MKTLFLLYIVLLAGCAAQSPPSRFFILGPVAEPATTRYANLLVGVGPVDLADYLNRNQMVHRDTEVRLQLDEFDRWAGDHGKNITTVLAENLARLLGSDGVLPYPWSSSLDLDYQVVVAIRRFDAGRDNRVILDAQWQLFGKQPQKLLAIQRSHIEVPATDGSQEALVNAQSQALARLGKVIAVAVRATADHDR